MPLPSNLILKKIIVIYSVMIYKLFLVKCHKFLPIVFIPKVQDFFCFFYWKILSRQ